MSLNLNQFTVAGRLTKDAKFFAESGDKKAMAAFTVAINNGKETDGTDRPATYVECTVRGKQANAIQAYLVKGKEVIVTGVAAVSTYQGQDVVRATLNCYVNNVVLGGGGDKPAAAEDSPL